MDKITLSDLEATLVVLLGLIGGLVALYGYIKKLFLTVIKPELEQIRSEQKQANEQLNAKIDALDKRVTRVDVQQTKNYLVRCMRDIESGEVNESELERFWEQYRHYSKGLDQNGYIKAKVEKLQKEGKL